MPAVKSLGRPVEILLVDDSPSDAELTRVALQNAAAWMNLHSVQSGEEALQYLRCGEGSAGAPRPDLVLLDLNMPGKDGRQVLADLRSDKTLANIPVIVLTTSDAPEDVVQSYRLKANCYVQKSVDLAEFMMAMKSLVNFWFTHVTLPSQP